jgi:hypothetical protein
MRTSYSTQVKDQIFRQCQKLFPEWTELSVADFDFDDPKGFSSFTMGIRSRRPAKPAAVLYRRLEGKDNAILDYATEKEVFLTLGDNDIAAHCYHYDDSCRIEAFYQGRSLRARDLFEPENLRQIADQLYRLHQLSPAGLPRPGLFELLHEKWGASCQARAGAERNRFPGKRTVDVRRATRDLQR